MQSLFELGSYFICNIMRECCMKVALIETRGEKYAVNKDQAGGFGTSTDTGTGIFGKIVNHVKRRGVRTPVLFLAYIHSIFEQEGHSVKFFDKKPNEEFDLIIMVTSMVDYKNEIILAKEIKQTSKAKLGFIGAFATVRPDIFLKVGDFVISGEPEDAAIKIARGEIEPKGIIISELIQDLDKLPFPKWEGHNIDGYGYYPLLKKKPFLTVLSSRGCSYDCDYCPYMVLETAMWRKRTPANVVDELEYLKKKFGLKSFLFRDPLFTVDMKRTKEICDEMIKRNLDLEWGCETRSDRLDEQLIDIMYSAGLRSIEIGVEAFDMDLLASLNRKPPQQKHQERIIEYSENKGVKMTAFYVLGIPGQTLQDMESTIAYSKKLNTSFAQFTIATPYPGTKFHSNVKDDIIGEDWEKYTSYLPLIKSDKFSPETVLKLKEKAFKEYYLRWNWILKRSKGIIK
jgi:anaerobic magnesium-protoporphyrin IX monomethyl ester cyclase